MNREVVFQPGDRCEVRIETLAYGGDGLGRINEWVVFVPFTAPGDEAEIELTEVKSRFARGRLIRLLRPSPIRIEPVCPYFGECGGCQYQHLQYKAQLEWKGRQIRELLERIGGFSNPPVEAVIPCPQPYGYRNRIMVRSQWDRVAQRLVIGFIRADNRLVVDVESCAIAEPELNRQLQQVRANPPRKGGLKVSMRIPPSDWEVPPDAFFQNNFHLLPKLAGEVRKRIQHSGIKHLIDAYCGVGYFALECADLLERFSGVEIDPTSIRAARRNQDRRGIRNGDFIAGPAEEWIPALLQRYPPERTAVLTDPPRVGCAPAFLRSLLETGPGQILYVSCHPATLARDLKILCAEGRYRLESVTPLDMFPQTQHVECVVDLRRC